MLGRFLHIAHEYNLLEIRLYAIFQNLQGAFNQGVLLIVLKYFTKYQDSKLLCTTFNLSITIKQLTMQHPDLLPTPARYPVIMEARLIMSTMTLQTAINLAFTRLTNYREQKAMVNYAFYTEVHTYLESLAINN